MFNRQKSVSASFLCHAQFFDELMRSSGRRGIFLKEKKGSSPELELLWLGEENDLTSALKNSEKAKDGLGLAQKSPPTALRFAVHFRTLDALSKFTKEIKLEDTAKLGRFKLSGVHVGIGIHGTLTFLVDQKWSEVEVLYVGDQHSVFLAGGIGQYGPMNYLYQGALRQLHFTALNSQAKQMVKDTNMASAASASSMVPSQPARSSARKQFFTDLAAPKRSPMNSSPVRKPEKRAPGHTGETPDPKDRKDM